MQLCAATENQTALMSSMLYVLSMCLVTVIQLTSSQSIQEVIQQSNNASSCGRTDQVLNQLMKVYSELLVLNSQVMTMYSQSNSELMKAVSQLQKDVAELKSQQDVNQLMNATSQLQKDVAELKNDQNQDLNQLKRMNSQLINATSQLQRDVAELKAGSRQKDARGKVIGPDMPKLNAIA